MCRVLERERDGHQPGERHARRARVLAHGTYDAHALAPEVRTLTSLPTLNATNAAEHPQWHAYVRRLYGPAAAGMLPLDLNTFTWFYWFAPLRLCPRQ